MVLEKVPGNQDIVISDDDDFITIWHIPFSCSGYTFTTMIEEVFLATTISVPTTVVVQSSVLSDLQISFLSSITSVLTSSDNDSENINITNSNYWKTKYVDNSGLKRTFISGYLEKKEIRK